MAARNLDDRELLGEAAGNMCADHHGRLLKNNRISVD